MAETREVSTLLMPQRKKKRSSIKGQSSGLTKIRWTRASWATKVANFEIPILRPRLLAQTQEPEGNIPMESVDLQEPVEGQPQLENLLYENELLKEDVQELREELQKWKVLMYL